MDGLRVDIEDALRSKIQIHYKLQYDGSEEQMRVYILAVGRL